MTAFLLSVTSTLSLTCFLLSLNYLAYLQQKNYLLLKLQMNSFQLECSIILHKLYSFFKHVLIIFPASQTQCIQHLKNMWFQVFTSRLNEHRQYGARMSTKCRAFFRLLDCTHLKASHWNSAKIPSRCDSLWNFFQIPLQCVWIKMLYTRTLSNLTK